MLGAWVEGQVLGKGTSDRGWSGEAGLECKSLSLVSAPCQNNMFWSRKIDICLGATIYLCVINRPGVAGAVL